MSEEGRGRKDEVRSYEQCSAMWLRTFFTRRNFVSKNRFTASRLQTTFRGKREGVEGREGGGGGGR